jgi:hypothetical protein
LSAALTGLLVRLVLLLARLLLAAALLATLAGIALIGHQVTPWFPGRNKTLHLGQTFLPAYERGNSLPKKTGPFARLPRCKKIQQPSGRNNGHYGNGGGRGCPYVASQYDINSKCCNLVGAFELC